MDCAYTYAAYSVFGPQGKLTEAMIKNNLPLPIDIYVAKFVLPGPVVTHNMNQLLLIMEGFDTSRYNPVYYNDMEAIDFLKEHFQEHEMYPSDDENDTVSELGAPETRTR